MLDGERQGLAARLREALRGSGVTNAKIAERCGVTVQAVTGWLRDGKIARRHIPTIAAATSRDIAWLMSGKGEPLAPELEANTSPGPPLRHLPLISWVQAGTWTEIEDPLEPGTYERLVPVTKRYSKRAYALRIEGDSMSSLDGDSFPDGSIIAVEPTQEARHGSYVVVRLEGSKETTFKQFVIDGDRMYLRPRNPRYPIIEIDEEATICGVVRQLVMDFDR